MNNTLTFDIGTDTIKEMNSISASIDNVYGEQMSRVISNLKTSADRFKKYSTMGVIGKMLNSSLEIEANITISVMNFETYLNKGANISEHLERQYKMYGEMYTRLNQIHDKFENDITTIEDLIVNSGASDSDIQRLVRKKNDLISAQTLCNVTSIQYDLSKENTAILIDKFRSIEQVLKPAISQNLKIGSSDFISSISKMF